MRSDAPRLIAAWCLSHFGYRAAVIALPLLAISQTGSAWTVGLVSGAAGVPAITAPWWTGSLQRRLASGGSLASLMAAEGVATLVVPAAASFDHLTPAVMVASGLAVGILNAVSGPLNASLVATVGDRVSGPVGGGAARLLAVQETALRVVMTAAPLATLPMIAVIGTTWTVALEGLLSLAGAATILGLPVTAHTGAPEEAPRVARLLRRHPEIRLGWFVRGVGCAAWFSFTLGLALLGQERGSGALLATVGLASYSAGAILGSSLGVLAAGSRRPAVVNSASWLVGGTGWVVMGLSPGAVTIGACAVLMGLAVPPGNAATTAMVTRACTGLERRAALTAQATVVTGCSTLGALVGGPLIAVLGARQAIACSGAAVMTASVVTLVAALSSTAPGAAAAPAARAASVDESSASPARPA